MDEEHIEPVRQPSSIRIRSTKMPSLSKHKWLSLFLDLVQIDLEKVNWNWCCIDNLSIEECKALKELDEAPNLVIKKINKGGNLVLLGESMYDMEVLSQLRDTTTYRSLMGYPFPALLDALNSKLNLGLETGLIYK